MNLDTTHSTSTADDSAAAAPAALRVDFISDLTCPWCAIGLVSLERAIERLGDELPVDLHLQPFELNPDIGREGEPIADYAARKYGASAADLARRHEVIHARGAEAGFAFGTRTHVYNTFDAHRLLHWAGLEGRQRPLKHALLVAYHRRGENPALHDVLLRAAEQAGLDPARAAEVLAGNAFAAEVRAAVRHWQDQGIHSVPTLLVAGRYLIQGGQSAAVFEQMLRGAAGLAR